VEQASKKSVAKSRTVVDEETAQKLINETKQTLLEAHLEMYRKVIEPV